MNTLNTNYGTKLPSVIKTVKLTGGTMDFPIYKSDTVPYVTQPSREIIGGGLLDTIGSALKRKVSRTLKSKAGAALKKRVGAALKKKVGGALKKRVGVALKKRVGTALRGKAGLALRKKVGTALKSRVGMLNKKSANAIQQAMSSPATQKKVLKALAPRALAPRGLAPRTNKSLKVRAPKRSNRSHNDLVRQAERMIYSGANF